MMNTILLLSMKRNLILVRRNLISLRTIVYLTQRNMALTRTNALLTKPDVALTAGNLFVKRDVSESKDIVEGDTAKFVRKITDEDVLDFIKISGDTNPIHDNNNKRSIVHGALLNSILSSVIGTRLPGNGTIVVSQHLNFPNKCYVNDVVTFKVELIERRKIMKVKFNCEVEDDKRIVLYGDARVILKRDLI